MFATRSKRAEGKSEGQGRLDPFKEGQATSRHGGGYLRTHTGHRRPFDHPCVIPELARRAMRDGSVVEGRAEYGEAVSRATVCEASALLGRPFDYDLIAYAM